MDRSVTVDLVATWRDAQLAEAWWVDPTHGPSAAVVVPLLAAASPTLALPYADLGLARSLAAAELVLWSAAVPALTGGAHPVAAAARVEVEEDPRGDTFTGSPLLEQVLAKHPPARDRLDSPLLRREHGWYLPRLLVRTVELGPSFELPYAEAFAATSTPDGEPRIAPASQLALAGGTAHLDVPDGPATVLQHGADVPDLETPWEHRWRGTVHQRRFTATERHDVPMARRRPTLRDRMRAARELERACKRGLRDAGHR